MRSAKRDKRARRRRGGLTAQTTETMTTPRRVRAPRGARLNCKGWHQEAARRCLMNNLDPDVAERPDELVVYGGRGKAPRDRNSFDAIGPDLSGLAYDETAPVR